jgi:hypothetical protein
MTEPQRKAMTPDAKQAVDMLNLFQSVGTQRFHVTLIDIDGHQIPRGALLDYAHSSPALRSLVGPRAAEVSGYMPNRHISELRRAIGPLLEEATRRQHNVIIRPIATRAAFVQLDDPPPESMERLRHAAFLIHRTSAKGHQVWLALDEKPDLDFKRRLKKGAGADIMATGATRIAGSVNFKSSYAPNFPRVEIVHAAPGQVTTRAALESLSILAEPKPQRPAPVRVSLVSSGVRKWPSYRKCLEHPLTPRNQKGDGPDRSRADFTWCKTALEWGIRSGRPWSEEEVAARLMLESEKAHERGQDYALQTARSAAAAVRRESGQARAR